MKRIEDILKMGHRLRMKVNLFISAGISRSRRGKKGAAAIIFLPNL